MIYEGKVTQVLLKMSGISPYNNRVSDCCYWHGDTSMSHSRRLLVFATSESYLLLVKSVQR